MKSKMLILMLLPLGIAACYEKKTAPPLLPEVTVITTEPQDVPVFREYVGQVFGFQDIAIWARVEGYLEKVHFEEGSRIEEGRLLYTVDSQPFEANVAAKLSMVAEAQTMLVKAKSDLDRIKPLAEQKAVSESDLDAAQAEHDAAIESVKAAQANLDAANIQLSYTTIFSPVSGIIGKTKAKVGDFVGRDPETSVLNTVSRIDTVLVQFFITENEYLDFIRNYRNGTKPEDTNDPAELELILSDNSVYEYTGRVDFTDRQVDPTTGAMLIQASFQNPEEILRPGQFARVKAKIDTVKDGILIPQRCLMELQGQYSILVVGPDDIVQKRAVTVGIKTDQFWLITDGLEPGEKVVYEGLQKVKDGDSATTTEHSFDTKVK